MPSGMKEEGRATLQGERGERRKKEDQDEEGGGEGRGRVVLPKIHIKIYILYGRFGSLNLIQNKTELANTDFCIFY